ncbi:hypothetical protein [Burkholderia lata]|uniref:hypothetical protein n=1 Tax=Burkholderia lata (strain ATCC 17760 / DSM 23089 / LMG 22485 / NCIMB 9086 / R18194 / 383) TaxID=482957 RepID=UPI0015836492|nr:hypothetical protein [Burkholderia lata]
MRIAIRLRSGALPDDAAALFMLPPCWMDRPATAGGMRARRPLPALKARAVDIRNATCALFRLLEMSALPVAIAPRTETACRASYSEVRNSTGKTTRQPHAM